MKKPFLSVVALISASTLFFAGCAQAPGTGTASSAASKATSAAAGAFKACMVSDQGGFDDKSFNQTSYEGLLKAEKDLGVSRAQVQSTSTADYAKNVQSMVDAKCNMIIGVGFALGDAVVAAAKANPAIKFAIVDSSPQGAPTNLKPLVFNTHESSFLAGYLAASMSKTGKVGTYGGQPYPSVTIFMDGYAQGVAHFNKVKGKSVAVIGWDPAKPETGSFVQAPADKAFVDVNAGKTSAQNQVSQGVDVLFPVAGNAGTGALQVAQASGGKVSAIWVDTDGCKSAAQYCSVLQTSVYKAMDLAVYEAIKSAKDGSFTNAPYIGNLKNDGTGISPFHEFDSKISAETKAEIVKLKADIVAGTIVVESKSANK